MVLQADTACGRSSPGSVAAALYSLVLYAGADPPPADSNMRRKATAFVALIFDKSVPKETRKATKVQ